MFYTFCSATDFTFTASTLRNRAIFSGLQLDFCYKIFLGLLQCFHYAVVRIPGLRSIMLTYDATMAIQ